MPGNPLVRFDEGRVGRTARGRPLSYSTVSALKPLPRMDRAACIMELMLTREQAWDIVCEFTKSEGLRKHALAVETCVVAYAKHLGEDEHKWSIIPISCRCNDKNEVRRDG